MMIKGKTRRFPVACAGAVMRNLIERTALTNASLLITIPAIASWDTGEQEGDGDNKRPNEGPTMASATLTEVAWAATRGDGRGDKGRGAWGSLVGVVYKGQGTT